MIRIERLKEYFSMDEVYATEHAAERFRQRGIKMKDVRQAVMEGEIIEQYPEDFPFPSCLVLGKSLENKVLHVVMSDEGSSSRIITAYYPDDNKWNSDYKIRKEV